MRCFNASDHTGHDVTFTLHTSGCGCCDCGDPEAWRPEGGIQCGYHSAREPGEAATFADQRARLASPLPDGCRQAIEEHVSAALDFLIAVVERAPEQVVPPPDPSAIRRLRSRKDQATRDAAPDSLLSFAIEDDLLPGPSSPSGSRTGSSVNWKNIFPVTRRSSEKGKGKSGEPEPTAGPASPTATKNKSTQQQAGPWGVVVWNDEKHSYAEVIAKVSETTGCSNDAALQVALRINDHGRDVLDISNDADALYAMSRSIANIDLGVSVRPAGDLFSEQVCDLVLDFLLDLVGCQVYGVPAEDERLMAQIVFEQLCRPPAALLEPDEQGMHDDDATPSRTRFERLLVSDIKLWKLARAKLKEIYVSLVGLGTGPKTELGVLFANVYSDIVENFLLLDREHEHTVLHFGVQIVTVPSVATVLVTQHGFLDTVLDLLYAFFTDQFVGARREEGRIEGQRRHIVVPPDYNRKAIELDGFSLRHRRYFHLFNEACYLLASPGVQAAVVADLRYLQSVTRFLDLFTNMNSAKRAVTQHVEFESDAWVATFNLTVQLAKLAKTLGECYKKANPEQYRAATGALVRYMSEVPHTFHRAKVGVPSGATTTTYELVSFRPDREPVSFHHPLNWLLAEMFRYAIGPDGRSRLDSIADVFPQGQGSTGLAVLKVAENVVRGQCLAPVLVGPQSDMLLAAVMALQSQIKAGLWVRNGFGLRAQLFHYRDGSLRENVFDQDIFAMQVFLCATSPSDVIAALLDRFGLREWFSDEPTRPFELSPTVTLLEELLWQITIFLSEPSSVVGWSDEKALRREVIHTLSIAPLPYTEVEKRVPERLNSEAALNRILAEVSTFKQPAGTQDVGVYSLRPELLLEVDPYFYRFKTNQREDCEKLVLAQVRKSTGDPNAVRVPLKLPLIDGPFAVLTHTFTSELLIQLIFTCLARFHPQSKFYSENLADQALHLIMKGLVEQGQTFARLATTLRFPIDSANGPHQMSLSTILQAIDRETAMAALKPKVGWCLDQIALLVGTPRRQAPSTTAPTAPSEDSKKAAAKARQAAIMNQFAAAQQAFLDSNDVDEEGEDEDEMQEENEASLGQCIVCQDELHEGDAFGSLALIQTSRLIRRTPLGTEADATPWLCEALEVPESLDHDGRADGPFGVAGRRQPSLDANVSSEGVGRGFPHDGHRGLFASGCGHLMHWGCFLTYYKSIEQRHATQVTRLHPENTERLEFLCPLCRSLGNVILPYAGEGARSVDDSDAPSLVDWLSQNPAVVDAVGPSDFSLDMDPTTSTLEPWMIDHAVGQGVASSADTGVSDISTKMLDRFVTVTANLGNELRTPQELSRSYTVDGDTVAYSVAAIEVASRGTPQPGGIVNAVTASQRQLLQGLLSVLRNLLCTWSGTFRAPARAATILASQFVVPEAEMATRKPLVLANPLDTLLQIAAVSPEAVDHAIKICYYLEVMRVTFGIARIGAKFETEWWKHARSAPASGAEDTREAQLWRSFLLRFFDVSDPSTWRNGLSSMDDLTLHRLIRAYTLPFLRRAAIIKDLFFDRPGASARALPQALEYANEHDRLRFQLGIPAVADVFSSSTTDSSPETADRAALCTLVMHWFHHLHRWLSDSSRGSRDPFQLLPQLEHPGIYELLGLPRNYNALLAEASSRKCTRCNTVPLKPSLCLVCGTICCTQSFCCMSTNIRENPEYGECNMHMWRCVVGPCFRHILG